MLNNNNFIEKYINNINVPNNTLDNNVKNNFAERLSTMCFHTKDKTDFFRTIFNIYDTYLSNYNDDIIINLRKHLSYGILMNLGKYMDLNTLEKVVLFLRFKETSNYKERIKMIKELCDISMTELIVYEKLINMYLLKTTKIHKRSDSDVILKGLNYKLSYEENNELLHQLYILKSTILLLKCVLYDYYKYDIVEFNDGKIKKKLYPKNKVLYSNANGLILSSKDVDLDFLFEIYQLSRDINGNLYPLTNNTISGIVFTTLTMIPIDDEYNKVLLDKNYHNLVNNRLTSYDSINNSELNSSYLLNRKVLLPKSGVVLLIEDNPVIESIFLKEIELNDKNNIIAITRYKDGTEITNSVILFYDLPYHEHFTLKKDEFDLGYKNSINYILNFFDPNLHTGKLKYEVISPVYWKYRDRNYTSDNDIKNKSGIVIKREYEIEIAPFLRKINGEPSIEAVKLSKKLGIILEKGYTIVKPHTRTYNKVK